MLEPVPGNVVVSELDHLTRKVERHVAYGELVGYNRVQLYENMKYIIFSNGFVIRVRRLAAAQEAAAQHRSVRDCSPAPGHSMAPHAQQPPAGAKGPSSLFFLSEDNAIRRYTRFIIEWPYPLLLDTFLRN